MTEQKRRKRNWFLMATCALLVITVVVAIRVHEYFAMPTEDWTWETDSNLTVQGIVTKIELNYESQGGSSWVRPHVFPAYIRINITEVVHADDDSYYNWNNSYLNKNFPGLGIGYDQPYSLNLQIGQLVECRGYFMSATDSAYSFKLTVSPYINNSYVETL